MILQTLLAVEIVYIFFAGYGVSYDEFQEYYGREWEVDD